MKPFKIKKLTVWKYSINPINPNSPRAKSTRWHFIEKMRYTIKNIKHEVGHSYYNGKWWIVTLERGRVRFTNYHYYNVIITYFLSVLYSNVLYVGRPVEVTDESDMLMAAYLIKNER